jgi:hypothetical protein
VQWEEVRKNATMSAKCIPELGNAAQYNLIKEGFPIAGDASTDRLMEWLSGAAAIVKILRPKRLLLKLVRFWAK